MSWIVFYLWTLTMFVGHIGGHSLFSCEPITLRMCQDLPYNTTFMPNLLNHYDQQTAALAMEVRLNIFFWHILKNDSYFALLTYLMNVTYKQKGKDVKRIFKLLVIDLGSSNYQFFKLLEELILGECYLFFRHIL